MHCCSAKSLSPCGRATVTGRGPQHCHHVSDLSSPDLSACNGAQPKGHSSHRCLTKKLRPSPRPTGSSCLAVLTRHIKTNSRNTCQDITMPQGMWGGQVTAALTLPQAHRATCTCRLQQSRRPSPWERTQAFEAVYHFLIH